MAATHSRAVSTQSPTPGSSGRACWARRIAPGCGSHAAPTRCRVGRSCPPFARTQGVNQPARTLVGFDPFCRGPAHSAGQQPVGTTLAWSRLGAEELLRFGGVVEWAL